ncbi:hypothetical protein [Natronorubrum halophilum]|uniref:hypothetical protein n=1 Tax=Natronorubrum halophilum TaxID=1702106 RepID=UPI0013CE48C6|nr:hypothetical protein [Natronorubrum halophilum]
MVTTAGALFIVSAVVLFFFWIYGLVSFYFDLRYQFVPAVRAYLRDDELDDRPDPEEYL